MKVKFYQYPDYDYLGWIENCKKEVVAFIRLDGSLVWEW
jgi:hypothetical protein